ncbi:AraC family two component transcriptional regulator [Aureibacillus halotolerans]|uniref:AraC family two component transcriptional regulator n=2 Tax=Aureibacillus halotolerans TaxID=1508390 RepID=A0A4V3D4W2_9BACI|nr:AraC family two component transcriptional regulator [Aureibacillus halotolerans]
MKASLMIVEDEPVILRGLKETIPWENYGVNLTASAKNGKVAIDMLLNDPSIDIVLTDVRMPQMDGLELAEYIARHFPKIHVVILSGYDEFSYAKKAISLGVEEYLLKPINLNELEQTMSRLSEKIGQGHSEQLKRQHLTLENRMYHQLFEVTTGEDGEHDAASMYVFPMVSMVKNYKEEDFTKWTREEWKTKAEGCFKEQGYWTTSMFMGENQLLTCAAVVDTNDIPLLRALQRDSSYRLQFVVSAKSVPLHQLSTVWDELVQTAKGLPLSKESIVYSTASPEVIKTPPPFVSEQKLKEAISENDRETMTHLVQLWIIEMEREGVFLEDVLKEGMQLLDMVMGRFTQNGVVYQSLPVQHLKDVDVTLYNSYSLVKGVLLQDLYDIADWLDASRSDNKSWLVEQAMNYIHQHYMTDIKALEVAKEVHISPNYFSSLFKEKTGKNFNEFVNELRIAKARELLQGTHMKVHEVAETVGFQEYKYFSEVFKRFSQMTPSVYRKLLVTKAGQHNSG